VLPASMSQLAVDWADSASQLRPGMERALSRSGARLDGAAATHLRFLVDQLRTEVLSVGPTAKVREYVVRYRVEFEVLGADGKPLLERTTIELERDFAFDQAQALSATAEQETLAEEMRREMVRRVMRVLGTRVPA
jgi:LPS-assembly lipoprotein